MKGLVAGMSDKKAVHKMIRRLMKEGDWKYDRSDRTLKCGPVKISAYMDGHVAVYVSGYEICGSLADWPWGLGTAARLFFHAHEQKYDERKMAEARAALLKAKDAP